MQVGLNSSPSFSIYRNTMRPSQIKLNNNRCRFLHFLSPFSLGFSFYYYFYIYLYIESTLIPTFSPLFSSFSSFFLLFFSFLLTCNSGRY
ncbi:hypothetical protein BDF14DRAFT_1800773 [Spinellus fusiger]|nr:hypothetical protein BDF14DRAFT_1800773 [Spinellus fusiger]